MIIDENNISLTYVASVLGDTVEQDGVQYLDTRLSSVCTSDNINKWAKSKPVVLSPTALASLKSGTMLKNITDWQKSANGMFGLTAGVTNDMTLQSIVSDYPEWGYTKPQGGTNQPFILGFFANYSTDAYPPLATNVKINSERKINKQQSSVISFIVTTNRSGTQELISINEFESKLRNYYLAVILRKENTSTYYWYTAENTIASSGTNIDMTISGEPFNNQTGRWEAIYCLAANRKMQGEETSEAAFYPIPFGDNYHYKETIEIVETSAFSLSNFYINTTINNNLFMDANVYLPSRDNNSYFVTSGALWIRCTIKNLSETNSMTLLSSSFRLKAPSYYMTQESVPISLRNANKETISSLSLAANQEAVIYIGTDNLFNVKNNAITTVTSFYQTDRDVQVTYNGVSSGGFHINIQSFNE